MAGQPRLVAAWYRGSWWLIFLRPIEFLFRWVVAIRRAVFRLGLKSVWRSPVPVVIVGNICVGGTGKTPVVIALVEYLQAQGIKPGVVSRGYGATSRVFPHAVTEQSRAEDCGDEPLLIYKRTACPCVVAPGRVHAVQYLLDNFDVDIVLSDDGLQHYALDRVLEIVVIDEHRGLGNGWCLPAGPLREPPGRLGTVDHVVYRGNKDSSTGVHYHRECLVNILTGQEVAVSPGQLGPNIHAVAGIGQPGQFFASLEQLGFSIDRHVFIDHHEYSSDDFVSIVGKPIIMTEKDAVKCRGLVSQDAWYLKISAQLPEAVKASVLGLVKRDINVHELG